MRHTHISGTGCIHETYYWGLNSLTMLHWTSTFGKLCVLLVHRVQTLLQSVSKHRFHSQYSFYIFICKKPPRIEVSRSHTHTQTHIQTGRISPSQRPISTQNTISPRDQHPCPRGDSNLRYLQSIRRIPHGHRDRRLFMYGILKAFFLKTLDSFVVT